MMPEMELLHGLCPPPPKKYLADEGDLSNISIELKYTSTSSKH